MQVQVPSHQAARVGDPATQQQIRGGDGTGGEHHHLRLDLEASPRSAGFVDGVAPHPLHATAPGFDPFCASAGENSSPSFLGTGDVGHQHRLLGAEETAQDAESALDAILAVVLRHQPRVAELLGAGANHPIHRIDLVLANRLHLEVSLDPFEAGCESLGSQRTQAELPIP